MRKVIAPFRMTLLQDDGLRNLRTKTAKSSLRRRPWNGVTDKGLERFLPTSVQKSYFMLSDAERAVLNTALGKYQPGVPAASAWKFTLAYCTQRTEPHSWLDRVDCRPVGEGRGG